MAEVYVGRQNSEDRQLRYPGMQNVVLPARLTGDICQIGGSESQVAHLSVKPGQVMMTEAGAMMTKEEGLDMSVHFGGDCCKRCCCAGESPAYSTFTNKTNDTKVLGITPNYNAKIIPLDMEELKGGMVIKHRAFLANDSGPLDWTFEFPGCTKCCCGGQGCCLSTISGKGFAYLTAGGTVYAKTLADGESITVDTQGVVAFEKSVKYDVQFLSCWTCCFAGEGFAQTVLTGPGQVILQTMSFEKLKMAVMGHK